MKLYSYYRSSAAYRVRIALNLKNIEYQQETVNLLTAEEQMDEYARINPQKLVPVLEHGDQRFYQSMAILEYLEEIYAEPALLPADAKLRAWVRALANIIACDIHPLNNLRVQLYLKQEFSADDEALHSWMTHWMHEGFRSAEITAATHDGPFVFGESATLADACLIPQLYNAHRFDIPLDDFSTLVAVETHCLSLAAFADAVPEKQPDAD